MSFAVVIEGMTIAAFVILLVGGKQRRESGWGALTVLALISATVQAISMALMVSPDIDLAYGVADTTRRTCSRPTINSSRDGT